MQTDYSWMRTLETKGPSWCLRTNSSVNQSPRKKTSQAIISNVQHRPGVKLIVITSIRSAASFTPRIRVYRIYIITQTSMTDGPALSVEWTNDVSSTTGVG